MFIVRNPTLSRSLVRRRETNFLNFVYGNHVKFPLDSTWKRKWELSKHPHYSTQNFSGVHQVSLSHVSSLKVLRPVLGGRYDRDL